MFLKFDEEDSFVPAIIFFYLFFWLGGIVCSLIFATFCSEYRNQPFFIVWLLGYGLVVSDFHIHYSRVLSNQIE